MTRRGCSCCKSCKTDTVFFDTDFYTPKSVTSFNKVRVNLIERVYRTIEKYDEDGRFQEKEEDNHLVAEYEHTYEEEYESGADPTGLIVAGLAKIQPRDFFDRTRDEDWRNGNLRKRTTYTFAIVGDGTIDSKAAIEYDFHDAYDFGTTNEHGFSNVKALTLSSTTESTVYGSPRSSVPASNRSANRLFEIESKHVGVVDDLENVFLGISYNLELDVDELAEQAIPDPHSEDVRRFLHGHSLGAYDDERFEQSYEVSSGVDISGFVLRDEAPSDIETFEELEGEADGGHNTLDLVEGEIESGYRESRPWGRLGSYIVPEDKKGDVPYEEDDYLNVIGPDLTLMEPDGPQGKAFLLLSSKESRAIIKTTGTLVSYKNDCVMTPISTELSEIRHENMEGEYNPKVDRVRRKYIAGDRFRHDPEFDRNEGATVVAGAEGLFLAYSPYRYYDKNWRNQGWVRLGLREYKLLRPVKANTELNFTNIVESDFFSQTYRDIAFGGRGNDLTITFSDPDTGEEVFSQRFSKDDLIKDGLDGLDLKGEVKGVEFAKSSHQVDGTLSQYRGLIPASLDLDYLYSKENIYKEKNFSYYSKEKGNAVRDFFRRAGAALAGVYSVEQDGFMQLFSDWVNYWSLETRTGRLNVKEGGLFHWPFDQGVLATRMKHYYDFNKGVSSEDSVFEAARDLRFSQLRFGVAQLGSETFSRGEPFYDYNQDGEFEGPVNVYNPTERRSLFRHFDYVDSLVMHYIGTEGSWGSGSCKSLSENPFDLWYTAHITNRQDVFGDEIRQGDQNLGYLGCEPIPVPRPDIYTLVMSNGERFYHGLDAAMIPTRARKMIDSLEGDDTPYKLTNARHNGPELVAETGTTFRQGWGYGNELIADGHPGSFEYANAYGGSDKLNMVDLGGLSTFRMSAKRSDEAQRYIVQCRDVPAYYEESDDPNDYSPRPVFSTFADGRPAQKIIPLDQSYRSQYSSTNNTHAGALRFRVRSSHVAMSNIHHMDHETFGSDRGDAFSFKPKEYADGYEFKGLVVSFKINSEDSVPKAVWFDGITHYEDLPEEDDPSYYDLMARQSRCLDSECNNIGPHSVLNYDIDTFEIEGQDDWGLAPKTQYIYDDCTFSARHDLGIAVREELEGQGIVQERSSHTVFRHFAPSGGQPLDSGDWGPKAEPEWKKETWTGFGDTLYSGFVFEEGFTEDGNLVLEESLVSVNTSNIFGDVLNQSYGRQNLMAFEGHSLIEGYRPLGGNVFGDVQSAQVLNVDIVGDVTTTNYDMVSSVNEGQIGALHAVDAVETGEDTYTRSVVASGISAVGYVGDTDNPWRNNVRTEDDRFRRFVHREIVSQGVDTTLNVYNDHHTEEIRLSQNVGIKLDVEAKADKPNSKVNLSVKAVIEYNALKVLIFPFELEEELVSPELYVSHLDVPIQEQDQLGFDDYLRRISERESYYWYYSLKAETDLVSGVCQSTFFGPTCDPENVGLVTKGLEPCELAPSEVFHTDLSADPMSLAEMRILYGEPDADLSFFNPLPYGAVTSSGSLPLVWTQTGEDVEHFGSFTGVLDASSCVQQRTVHIEWEDFEFDEFDSLNPPDLELLGKDARMTNGSKLPKLRAASTILPKEREIDDPVYYTPINPEQRGGQPSEFCGGSGPPVGPEYQEEYDTNRRTGKLVGVSAFEHYVNIENMKLKLISRKEEDG